MQKIKRWNNKKILNYILIKLFNCSVLKFHYMKLDLESMPLNYNGSHIPYMQLTESDLVRYADKHTYNKLIDRLRNENYKLFGIVDNGDLVYYSWISLKYLDLPYGLSLMLKKNEGYLEDSYCKPAYRGLGFHSNMNIVRLKKIKEHNKKFVIAIVLEGNTPALRVQKKCGFIDLGTFWIIKIFGKSFSTLKADTRNKQFNNIQV